MIKIKSFYIIFYLLVFSHYQTILGQNRWVKTYHEELNTPMLFITGSYDKGCFISGRQIPNYPRYNWLIKTDINGDILWEKTIGNGINTIILMEMMQDDDGSLYSSGITCTEDPYGDPFILKLNPCGEKDWCTIFHTENHYDFAQCLALTPDGGCAITLNFTSYIPLTDRICLAKFSNQGELEWKICYNSPDSLLGNEDDANLITTPDNGFLITGWCYYTNPEGTLSWLHPYYIKTDSLGNVEWETVIYKDTGDDGGQAWATIISPDSIYFYSAISHYDHITGESLPAIVKMDMEGNPIGVYDFIEGYPEGKTFDLRFIDDSMIAVSSGWGYSADNFHSMALIVDTLGSIIQSVELHDDIYLSYVRDTFDDKIYYYTETSNDNEFNVYLYKFNRYLESDTLYSTPFVYDSLCPYPILSDTIVPDDCGLIVAVPERPLTADRQSLTLSIWPNPANQEINLQFTGYNLQFTKENRLEIFDVFGRKMLSQAIPRNQDRLRLDISALPAGLYIAIVKSGNNPAARGKFVVAK